MRKLIAAALPAASSHPHMHMVLVCGKDEAYKAEVQAIADDYGLKNVHVVGYADEVAALMEASDVIVCKAGGLTVTECLCVGTPMILVGRAYGQEKINVAMLTSSGAATHVTTSRELIGILDALEDTPERLQTLTVNANLLRRPHAADEIAQLTLQLASKGHAHSGEESDLNSAAERSETPRMSRKWFFRVYTGHKPAHIR